MRGVLFLLMYTSMIPAALSAAHVGIMFYVWVSMIAPDTFTFGVLQQIPFSKIAIFIAILAILRKPAEQKPFFDVTYAFMLAFFCQCAISFAFSLTDGPQFYNVADRVWKIAVLCALLNPVLRGRLQIHSLMIVVAVSLGVQGAIEGLKYLLSAGGHQIVPPQIFGDNNSFGLFLLINIPIFLYLLKYTIDPFIRLAIVGGVLINTLAIVGTGSRGAVVGFLAVTLLLILQSKRRISTLLVVAAVAGSVVWFVPARVYQRAQTIETAGEDSSFMSRVIAWKLNTLVALDRPLLGGGFSAVEDPKVWVDYVPKFQALSFIPTPTPDRPRAAHSVYFQALGDLGFPGLLFYLGILGSTFLSLRRIRKMTADNATLVWAYDLAGYLRLTMVALIVSGAALSVVYYDLPFLLFCVISILRRTVRDELEATEPRTAWSAARFQTPHHRPGLTRPV